jgi:hypothetical protein
MRDRRRLPPVELAVGQVWRINRPEGGSFRVEIDALEGDKALCHTFGLKPRVVLIQCSTFRNRRRGAALEVTP